MLTCQGNPTELQINHDLCYTEMPLNCSPITFPIADIGTPTYFNEKE